MNGLTIRNSIGPALFLVAMAFIVMRFFLGCKPVEDPAAHRQAIVTSLAHGVKATDKACASIARAKKDEQIAKDCAFAYDAARLSLDAAEDKLDADTPEDVACEVAQALAYASQMAAIIEKHGGKLPRALTYATPLAMTLGGLCHG
jgi:hypothetical protein